MNWSEIENAKDKIGHIIKDLNNKTVCFTGHRSQKLPWKFNEQDERCKKMKLILSTIIENTIKKGYDTFICGMAIGFDIICAETVISLKNKYPHIKVMGALPCQNQDLKWKEKDKLRYRELILKLDKVRCVYDTYIGAECMHERNRYMVNNSSLLIALYSGLSGGTRKTIEYAQEQGLEIIIINPQQII